MGLGAILAKEASLCGSVSGFGLLRRAGLGRRVAGEWLAVVREVPRRFAMGRPWRCFGGGDSGGMLLGVGSPLVVRWS